MPSVVLLCGVPGTRLSAIAETLGELVEDDENAVARASEDSSTPPARVWDLENRIRNHYRRLDNGPESYSMFEVVLKPGRNSTRHGPENTVRFSTK